MSAPPIAVRRLLRLSWQDQLRNAEAFVFLGLARLAVLTVPFRLIARAVGPAAGSASVPVTADPPAQRRALALGRLIERVGRRTPWRSNCLAQAVAATFMLRRRGLGSTMYFGLAKNENGDLDAHAWTRSHGTIVTGGYALERYAVVAVLEDGAVTTGARQVLRSLRHSGSPER